MIVFSGIVEELGTVAENAIDARGRLGIAASTVVAGVAVGDSIAVNGCCLTVVEAGAEGFVADVMPETARRTNLGALTPGDRVNLEAALAYGDRVGGHMVSGHVDGTGEVVARRAEENAIWVTVAAPAAVLRHTVPQGCVAVDGISLTVVEVLDAAFTVSLIPHTVESTTARGWRPGDAVNLESDLVAKYIERLLPAYAGSALSGAQTP